MGELTLEEFRELLPLYAIDALPVHEERQVAARLVDDLDARREVTAYRETIAAVVGDALPPVSLWDRIHTAIEADSESGSVNGSSVVSIDEHRRRPKWRTFAISGVAAALGAVLTLAAATAFDRNETSSSASPAGIERAAAQARAQRGATVLPLKSTSGVTQADVVYLPDGNAWFESQGLPDLPPNRTYQLWAIVGPATDPHVISAGVLGSQPGTWGFRFNGPVIGFAVTEESAPGVVASANDPLLVGRFA